MWVRGHSRSLKLVPFESFGAVSYSPSIVTIAVSVPVCEIFSVKEWRDREKQVRGRSRSLIQKFLSRRPIYLRCISVWQIEEGEISDELPYR